MNRRDAVLAIVALGAAPLSARAQPAPRVARIGFLSFLSASIVTPIGSDPFRAGLRDLGYVEGRNIQIDFRYADGDNDRLAGLAAGLVALNVDVIVSYATGVRAARRATATIPIVMANFGDPIAAGFAASLAHPGGQRYRIDLLRYRTHGKAAGNTERTQTVDDPDWRSPASR